MPARSPTPKARRRWPLWHPRQRLWNRALLADIEAACSRGPRVVAAVTGLVIVADSVLLLGAVLRRRARLLGLRSLRAPRAPRGVRRAGVLYVDCGVHEDGHEIRLMRQWFARGHEIAVLAFEAGSRQFAAAAESLRDVPDLDLRREALVGPDHTGATVTLYRSGDGYADSIFAAGGADREDVPAARLSEVLLSRYGSHEGPVILRMNIEGAELAVIEDLVAAGLDRRIDGYHGMWDDVARIDPRLDDRLRRVLAQRAIAPLTFNGRDVGYALRRLAIRTDVATSIRRGELRGHDASPTPQARDPRTGSQLPAVGSRPILGGRTSAS